MLKNILKDITDKHDVTLLSDEESPCVVNAWLPTGCLALDTILGGGLPVGRITEIYGDTSTGKSLIAAQVAALAQEDGHIVAYIDTESAVSLPIMAAVGVNTEELIYSSPDTIEQVFSLFQDLIDSKTKHYPDKVLLLIWDSIAATSVDMEMEADYGKSMMGRHAQLLSQSLRKITRLISKKNVCCLFLNQTRQKIGVMFGDDETTFGGKAVGFYSSVRVRLKLGTKIKQGNKIIGIETRATVTKNKVAVPFRSAALPIYFGMGIDDAGATFDYLKDNDIIKATGSWYNLTEDIRFMKKGFDKVYDEHFDLIVGMIDEYTADN